MAPHETKDPIAILKNKFRSLFGSGDPPKNNNLLPPKFRFSIWHFLIAMLFLLICSHSCFRRKWKPFPTASLNHTSPKATCRN